MDLLEPFLDPVKIAGYVEATPRKVPGLADLHRMAMLLLAEQAPETADILVVGAGGGLELKAFAEAQAQWRFVGVDPSAAMLDLAGRVLESFRTRVMLQHGYVDAAPLGPFDGATCLLTLHFLRKDERLRTLREIRGRLKPGARLVVAHHSHPPGTDLLPWLVRSLVFADAPGAAFKKGSGSAAAMAT